LDIESEEWLPDIESVAWLPDIESEEWLPVIVPPDIEPDEWLPDIDPSDIEPDEWLPDIESVFEDCASATPEKQALRITKDASVLMERNMTVLLQSHLARLGAFPVKGIRIGLIFCRAFDRHRV
jgi:hypothetical protein